MELPRNGPTRLELTFVVLEVEQEYDGFEKRVVYWDASSESACLTSFVFFPRAEE